GELGERIAGERGRLSPGALEDVDEILGFLRDNAAKIDAHARRANEVLGGVMAQAYGRSARRDAGDLNSLLAESVSVASRRAQHHPRGSELAAHAPHAAATGPAEMPTPALAPPFTTPTDTACAAMQKKKAERGAGSPPRLTVRTIDRGPRVEVRIRDNGT